jgi:chromosome segregation ATPase
LKEDFSKAHSFSSETSERDLSNLKTELLLSEANVTSLNQERRQLELMVMENESIDSKIIEDLRLQLQNKDEVIDVLENKVKVMNQDLLHLKQDFEKSESHGDMTTSGSDKSVTNVNSERELEELRATYFAAQEWMQNAVQYHESLSEQVTTLQVEKAQVERLLEEEKKKNSDYESNKDEMQEQLSIALRSLDESTDIRNGLELKLKSLEDELMTRQEEIQELEKKVSSKGKLPHELEAELLMLREVRLGLDETREFQELRISELQSEVDSLTKDREEKQLDIDDLTTKLKEFEVWSEAAQHRLHEMESEKEALEHEVSLANLFKEKVETLTNQIASLEIANQNLNEHLAVKADEVIGLNRDLEEQKGIKLELRKKYELLELKSQESERHFLTQVKELEGTLRCKCF